MALRPKSIVAYELRQRRHLSDEQLLDYLRSEFYMTPQQAADTLIEFRQPNNPPHRT